MSKIVYIDGQNFLYKAAEVLIDSGKITDKDELTKIDIRSIFEQIFEPNIEIRFYGAKVKVRGDKGKEILEKSRRFSDNARRLRNTLQNQHIHFDDSGKLMLKDGERCRYCGKQDMHFQEKGVDVGIAVDMLVDRYRHGVNQFILVSSDTDLIPAIKAVRLDGGEVVYTGFDDKLTKAIISESSSTQVIRNSEIVSAYETFNQPRLDLK